MKNLAFLFSLIVLTSGICLAQTSAFTYQGKLASSGTPANGDHQFEFKLFDAATGTSQIGTTQTITATVQNGSFSTGLDFGATAFVAGQDRWLEVSVRLNGSSDPFTVLNPRQQVNSVPFAVRSLKATNADTADNATTATNAMTANTATTAENVTGVVQVSNGGTGSTTQNFIDLTSNQTIGGNKTFGGALSGNIVSTATQYDIGGQRILSAPGAFNTFVGRLAGRDNTGGNNVFVGDSAGLINTGSSNAFFGYNAGQQNTTGGNNSFFGDSAGSANGAGSNNNSFFGQSAGRSNAASDNSFFGTLAGADNFSGSLNSFFGSNAGRINSLGNNNSFFGSFSGDSNTLGEENAFFGAGAGGANSTGHNNNFFGRFAGQNNTSGHDNSFFGRGTGSSNVSGTSNTLIGTSADVGSGTLSNATAIGAGAIVSQSNSLVLGSTSSNTPIGIGVSAPAFKLHVVDSQNTGLRVQTNTAGGTVASFGSFGAFRIDSGLSDGGRLTVLENGNVGIGTNNPAVTLEVNGVVKLRPFEGGGIDPLCLGGFKIATCSSSIRYKQNINAFNQGLSLIKQLRPVSFNWRVNNQADVGLVAEEVARVEPLLATTNAKGEIEGVKYDRVGVVLVNAVQEQQLQIEEQQRQIDDQKTLIVALKALVCSENVTADICKPQN